MKVKRRIFNPVTGEKKEVIEEVELVSTKQKVVFVKLKNGDIIKRKLKDVVEK